MDLFAIFTTAFIVGFSGAMMPGPLLTVTVAETARRGFWTGPLIVLGHAFLELALVAALVLGLASVLTSGSATFAIGLVGGFFLIYMGYQMALDAYRGKIQLDFSSQKGIDTAVGEDAIKALNKGDIPSKARESGSLRPGRMGRLLAGGGMHPVLAGALISFSNPYWSLWWATVGLGYITLSLNRGGAGVASFFSGHILADLVWYSLISAAVAGGRRFLTPGVYRGILMMCGVFLVFLGGYFIYSVNN